MLSLFALMLPFSVCLVWVFAVLLRGMKSYSDKLLVASLLLSCVYFFCDANFVSQYVDYKLLVILDIIAKFVILAVFPLACLYIRSLTDTNPVGFPAYLMLLPSILLGVVSLVVYGLLGIEESASLIQSLDSRMANPDNLDVLHRAQYVVCTQSYNIMLIVFILITLAYIIYHLVADKFKFEHFMPFIKGQKPSLVSNMVCVSFALLLLVCALRIGLGRYWLISHSGISSMLSTAMALCVFMMGYVGAVPSLPGGYVNMERLMHPFEAMRQPKQEYIASINSGPVVTPPAGGYEKLNTQLTDIMNNQQLFLQPELTIEDLATRLETNRTYISKLVNIQYGMPFRDYLNKLRIDYSKHLMQDEPDAVIEYIALKSGFNSSSQFIRKFKEVENMTPSTWRSQLRR